MTNSRALRESSRRPQERSGSLQDDTHRRASCSKWEFPEEHLRTLSKLLREPQSACLNSFGRLRISSASPKVGVQKYIRRSCAMPLSSSQQASGQLAPCMAMHGFTLALSYINMYRSRNYILLYIIMYDMSRVLVCRRCALRRASEVPHPEHARENRLAI